MFKKSTKNRWKCCNLSTYKVLPDTKFSSLRVLYFHQQLDKEEVDFSVWPETGIKEHPGAIKRVRLKRALGDKASRGHQDLVTR